MSRIASLNLSRAQKAAMYVYAAVAAVLVALYAPSNAFAQTGSPADQMISSLQTGVIALLGAGVAIVVAVALFYAGKAFVSRIRS